MEWAVALVYGFRDAPVSFFVKDKISSHCRNETGGGENDYAIVLVKNGERIIFKIN
jgi:hypothetical protein